MGLRTWLSELRSTSPRQVQLRVDAIAQRIASLSLEEARRAVEELLLKGSLFRCVRVPPSPEEAELVAEIHGSARELFLEYKSVETNSIQLHRGDIRPYPRGTGLTAIGTDLEHAIVVVEQTTGTVAVIEDDQEPNPDLSDSYPSIWHYLLFVAETSERSRQ
jgi:hypothetical protein